MPKRKKADADANHDAKRQKQAPQAVPHARGGTHRVRQEHLTHTKWDHINRRQMEEELKSRPGLYRKDLKKHEIARILADDDLQKRKAESRRQFEIRKKQAEAKKKKELEEQQRAFEKEAKEKRRAEREQRGEEGGDTTPEELEQQILGAEMFGNLLDDEVDDSVESETDTSISAASPLFPHSKLRIFECVDMPSADDNEDWETEVMPSKIPYAVMNLVTTSTEETLELPGRTYPESIGADFVPKLTQHVMNCARNGVLVGTLRKAIIETGQEWAERTKVQGWNGRMYLKLPQRTSAGPLTNAYTDWKTKNHTRAEKIKAGKALRRTSHQRRKDAAEEKKQRMLDIYASSEYRPPICFAPVQLEYPNIHNDDDDGPPRTLENLYYVRFPGMHLPHFFFWARPHEWEDPTTSNPAWLGAKLSDEQLERSECQKYITQKMILLEEEEDELYDSNIRNRSESEVVEDLQPRPYTLDSTKIRIKKNNSQIGIGSRFRRGQKHPPLKTDKFETAVWNVERQLYENGLAVVLQKYRDEFRRDGGKERYWKMLIERMPDLYPSGQLPEAPPVHVQYQDRDQIRELRSLAEKIADIQVGGHSPEKRRISPILGDEPWTRDDDEYWDIVDAPRGKSEAFDEEDIQTELLRTTSPGFEQSRISRQVPELDEWLDSLSASYAPLMNANTPSTPVGKILRAVERDSWEELFEQAASDRRASQSLTTASRTTKAPTVSNPVNQMPVAELKWQLYSLMNKRLKNEQQCRVCFEPFVPKGDLDAVKRHYQMHHDEADLRCPFCGMEWGVLDSKVSSYVSMCHTYIGEALLCIFKNADKRIVESSTYIQPRLQRFYSTPSFLHSRALQHSA